MPENIRLESRVRMAADQLENFIKYEAGAFGNKPSKAYPGYQVSMPYTAIFIDTDAEANRKTLALLNEAMQQQGFTIIPPDDLPVIGEDAKYAHLAIIDTSTTELLNQALASQGVPDVHMEITSQGAAEDKAVTLHTTHIAELNNKWNAVLLHAVQAAKKIDLGMGGTDSLGH